MEKEGLEDVVAAESSICDVNGTEGRLIYQGYDIHDLAEHSSFEEVVYLLWFGRLPNQQELSTIQKELSVNRQLPEAVVKIMQDLPRQANPMDVLRSTVSLLSMWDPDAGNNETEANVRKSIRLTAQIPTIIAYWDNLRNNRTLLAPKAELSLAANFLYLLTGQIPDAVATKSLDIALILHADHELNASTFAARVAAGTLSDMYSAVVAAIGTLAGPLHGGANQEVIKMLLKIGDSSNERSCSGAAINKIEAYIQTLLSVHKKIAGFGHRVYRTEDPRATHLRKMSQELGKLKNQLIWYEMSRKIEEVVFKEKKLYANVDFYSASVYYMLGIPIDLFTPVFAASRISGWTAHVMEQYANNRLIRPRAEYTGKKNLKYVPITNR